MLRLLRLFLVLIIGVSLDDLADGARSILLCQPDIDALLVENVQAEESADFLPVFEVALTHRALEVHVVVGVHIGHFE